MIVFYTRSASRQFFLLLFSLTRPFRFFAPLRKDLVVFGMIPELRRELCYAVLLCFLKTGEGVRILTIGEMSAGEEKKEKYFVFSDR